jgi:hypothetical protein
MMEAVRSSESSLNLYQITRRYIAENNILHIHRREYVKPNKFLTYFAELVINSFNIKLNLTGDT